MSREESELRMEVLDTEEQGKVGLLELTAETKNQASGNKGKGDI